MQPVDLELVPALEYAVTKILLPVDPAKGKEKRKKHARQEHAHSGLTGRNTVDAVRRAMEDFKRELGYALMECLEKGLASVNRKKL